MSVEGQSPTVVTWAIAGFFLGAFGVYLFQDQVELSVGVHLIGGATGAVLGGSLRLVVASFEEKRYAVSVPQRAARRDAQALLSLLNMVRRGEEMEAWRAVSELSTYQDSQVLARMLSCVSARVNDPKILTTDPKGLSLQALESCLENGGFAGWEQLSRVAETDKSDLGSIARRILSDNVIKVNPNHSSAEND